MAKFKKTQPIATVLTIVVGFLFIYLIILWKHREAGQLFKEFFSQYYLLILIFVVGFLGVASKTLADKIDFLWMKLAWLLSKIMPNVILSVFFYGFLFPIAILAKLFGNKNPLYLKNTEISLFKERNEKFDKKSLEKMW